MPGHPLVVTVSHQLGRAEAKRRLENGLGYVRGQLAALASSVEYSWSEDRLNFSITAIRQCINGHIDIEDRLVRIELSLPLILRLLSKPIVNRIRSEGWRLLGKPNL